LFEWYVMASMMDAAVGGRLDHRQVRAIFAREAILSRPGSRGVNREDHHPDRRGRRPGLSCRIDGYQVSEGALTAVEASPAAPRHDTARQKPCKEHSHGGLRPLDDRVLVKQIEAEEKTAGGGMRGMGGMDF
jgi:hypothetical protein